MIFFYPLFFNSVISSSIIDHIVVLHKSIKLSFRDGIGCRSGRSP